VWPPEHTPLPSMFWPTIGALFLVASNLAMMVLKRAARRADLAQVRRWLIVASVLSVIFVGLRWLDFQSLNVRWDTNAYASAAWMVAGFHATLVLTNAVETVVFAWIMFSDKRTERHFSDVYDSCDYWIFLTWSWVPLYATVFLGPNWLR
jgi:heme/copper-type cytochrome/quinol oxidase subunit 3